MLTSEKENLLTWYVREFQSLDEIARPNEDAIKAVMSLLFSEIPPYVYPKIVDVGSGSGLITHELSLYYPTVYAVDFRYPKLRDLPEKDDSHIQINGDFHELASLLPYSVDAVLTNHSFEHSYAPFLFCCEVYCSLREQGRWIINLPDPHGPHAKLSYHHPFVLKPEWLTELFEATGFKILKMEVSPTPYLDYWWVLERTPLRFLSTELSSVYTKRLQQLGRL